MDDGEIGTSSGVGEGSNNIKYAQSEVMIDVLMEKRRMEKVPLTMRTNEKIKGYFNPMVVSIGPYHHGKEELQMAERIKPIIADLYISSSGRDMDEFRSNILEIVDDARSCYLEGSTEKYSDEQFAEMMLLDGLFVSAHIESMTSGSYRSGIHTILTKHLGKHASYLMELDMVALLENQLPFKVIELLISLKSENNKLIEMLDKIFDDWETQVAKRLDKKELRWLIDKKQPLHILECLWLWQNTLVQPGDYSELKAKSNFYDFGYSFKSISVLKAKGIHAKSGSVSNQRDFKLKSYFLFAVLEIPPLMLNLGFIKQISNQIAYECTPNNPNNLPTMAYMNFMKSLINSVEDVKELRAKNILFSPGANDEEVVKMFNSISTIEMEYVGIYNEVKEGIQSHYNNKAKTWLADLIHKYFSSPWTLIAFTAATALIITSFLQTYYTIFPRK